MYIYTHRVTYAECTVGNHIYHSRYLDLLEAARGEDFQGLLEVIRERIEARNARYYALRQEQQAVQRLTPPEVEA